MRITILLLISFAKLQQKIEIPNILSKKSPNNFLFVT